MKIMFIMNIMKITFIMNVMKVTRYSDNKAPYGSLSFSCKGKSDPFYNGFRNSREGGILYGLRIEAGKALQQV